MIDERQKKIIKNTLLIIGVLITIACFICFALTKAFPEITALWYIGIFGSFSPTIIGVIVKIYISIFMRKQNIKAIDNHLVESGIKPLTEIKKSKKTKKNTNKTKDNNPYGY